MQILLLATGESNKLQPVTNMVPAPLLPVTNRPLMLYPLELLARQDFKQILVALHNQAGHIESYLGNGERWGVKLDYLLQRRALGNGGAVKQAASALANDLLLVVPGDTIIDFDVSQLVAFHQEHNACLTAFVSMTGPQDGRKLFVDQTGKICSENKAEDESQLRYDTGLYLLSPEVLDLIPAGEYCDIQEHLIPLLLMKGVPAHAFESRDYWNSLSSFAAYQDLQKSLLANEPTVVHPGPSLQPYWQRSRMVADGIWIGRNNVIHPDVRLQPPVVIGDNCYVGQGVQLGPAAIIGNNVVIDEEATILDTAVFNGTYVGRLVNLENRLVNKNQVVDIATGKSVQITDQFLVGRAFQTVSDTGLFQLLEKGVALFLLLTLSWFMVVIGLLVWLRHGRIFTKVTYYHSDIESSWRKASFTPTHLRLWEYVTKNKNGAQSALGQWLQRWDLYRLPQLWNIVSGELALVGVKPLNEEEIAFIHEEWQQKRFEQKAGFTGLWYVQPQDLSGIETILVADTYYTATQSWRGDIKILKQTIPAWWRMARQRKRSILPSRLRTSNQG